MKVLKFLASFVMCAGLLQGMNNSEPDPEPISPSHIYKIYDGSPSTSVIIKNYSLNPQAIKDHLIYNYRIDL